jgi:tripartite-type tricarboxylate transporter receptor subunit TctC
MTTTPTRRWLLQAAAASALPTALSARALAAGPDKPALPMYKFVVGFGAGGVPDAGARAMATRITEQWSIPAFVENKVGAGGMLAALAVLNAPADGTTILSVSPAHATAPSIFKKMPYDTLRDFTPIKLIGEGPALIVAPATIAASMWSTPPTEPPVKVMRPRSLRIAATRSAMEEKGESAGTTSTM